MDQEVLVISVDTTGMGTEGILPQILLITNFRTKTAHLPLTL